MTLYQKLMDIRQEKGAGYFVLLDPDHSTVQKLVSLAELCNAHDVDALLVGGSLLFSNAFDELVKTLKNAVSIPVILFPGSSRQLSRYADGLLFMSLISGRNPTYLIGEQVLSAPIVRNLGIEPIPTGYMLMESGKTTSVEFMSNTKPLPRDKPDIAIAHALAGEYLGMKMIYLEGGSGADCSVPDEIIGAVSEVVTIPLIVGGGIRTPEEARAKVESGASFVVTGNIIEKEDFSLVGQLAAAVHYRREYSDRRG